MAKITWLFPSDKVTTFYVKAAVVSVDIKCLSDHEWWQKSLGELNIWRLVGLGGSIKVCGDYYGQLVATLSITEQQ